jgi:hypothetical protein
MAGSKALSAAGVLARGRQDELMSPVCEHGNFYQKEFWIDGIHGQEHGAEKDHP